MSDYQGIDLQAVRDRLDALGRFNRVEDVLSAADAMETFDAFPPAAFVSTGSERAGPSTLIGRQRQRVRQTVSILICRGAERAARQDGPDDAELDKAALLGCVVGWSPPGAESALDYVSYSVNMIARGLVWTELLVAADYHFVTDQTAG